MAERPAERISTHDPGGKVRLPMQNGVWGDAFFGGAGDCYRHWLLRCWGDPDGPFLLSIGLNPSTAAHYIDDPTIRWELDLTRRLGLGRFMKCNAMDWRATKPPALLAAGVRPCSDQNRVTIRELAAKADRILVNWGKVHKSLRRYTDNVLIDLKGYELWCLGTNQDGTPKHPLFLPRDTEMVRFR